MYLQEFVRLGGGWEVMNMKQFKEESVHEQVLLYLFRERWKIHVRRIGRVREAVFRA